MARSTLPLSALALGLALAGAARAGAPQPVRPVSTAMFSGRWYEIARIAEGKERRCGFATTDFAGRHGGGFSVIQTCHEGSADGPAHRLKASLRILPAAGGAKVKMGVLGGLVTQEYWILDHADDDTWALMATPGGRYLWLLARRPALAPPERAAAVARIAALGYQAGHLVQTR